MKLLKRCSILIIAIMMLSGISIAADETYDYTLLIYMNGSDLETDSYAGTDDLIEMIAGTLPPNVAVIIETGGTRDWHTDEYDLPTVNPSRNQRWKVTDTTIELLEDVSRSNMGEASTLTNFINYGVTNYDSDQYSLIMWNHGAGSVYGYGADEWFNYDSLTLDEMQTALADSYRQHGQRFELVGFDACLMGSVEVGHVLAPYADYLLASEELEPGHGWDYEPIINHLNQNPNTDPVSFGQAIMDGFVKQSKAYRTDDAITLSLVDLSKIDEVVSALDGLFGLMTQDIRNSNNVEAILKARLDAESYGEGSPSSGLPDSDMVDIIDYANRLSSLYPSETSAVISAVEDAVTLNINSDFKPDAAGLSIYVPARDKDTMGSYALQDLYDIDMSTVYNTYIQNISNTILSGGVTLSIDPETTNASDDNVVEGTINFDGNGIEGDDQYFYFQMDPDELKYVEKIDVVMGIVDDIGDIQYLARDLVDDELIDESGLVVGETLDNWVQINGWNVAMYYESYHESGVMTYFIPIMLNGVDADLIVIFSDTYPEGEILGAREYDPEHGNIQNRNLMPVEPGDVINFVYEYDIYDAYYDTYAYDGWYYLDDIVVQDELKIEWQPLAAGEYVYCFEILDIYGDVQYTDWLTYIYYDAGTQNGGVDDAIWDNLETNVVNTSTVPSVSVIYEDLPWLYSDVEPPSEWAVPHINTAYNNGLMVANTYDGFKDEITREVFCELVVNMYENITGKPIAISNPYVFTDTSNIEIVKAYQLGIVTGYGDGIFAPDDLITREQLITMFYRTLVKLDARLAYDFYPRLTFDDADEVSSWADDAARLLVHHELINGVGDNQLAPQNNATVEQSLKLVNGVYEFYQAEYAY